jgi:hypothetical protein
MEIGGFLEARVSPLSYATVVLTLIPFRLPLDTVLLLISELLPKIQEIQASQKTNSTSRILDYLGSADLKDVLPKLGPPSPRRFMVCPQALKLLVS